MNELEKDAAKKTATFLTGLLTGWGVPANWAKVVTGAVIGGVIGVLLAVGALTSCTTVTEQRAADGTVTKKAITLDPELARYAAELWGNPLGPVVKVTRTEK